MKPVITNVIAGLLGMALGWVVVGDSVSAMFAPTQVTWDATSCPPGVYNITSTAWNLSTGESRVTSSSAVTLPLGSVVQVFPNLPAGTYSVSATALRTDGESFGSATQTLTGLGDPTGGPGMNDPGIGDRNRPPETPPIGTAVPRKPDGGLPPPGNPGAGSSSTTTPATTAAKNNPPLAKLATPAMQASAPFQITFDSNGNLVSTDADWQRVGLTDLDADGRYDVVTIELVTGDVWIIHLTR